MPKPMLKWGDWNAICDICGFRFKASELTKDWQGLMVCKQDYEMRHPQDFLRVRPDNPAVPWSRPEGADQFIFVCWIWGTSAYADLGEADCMQADLAPFTYQELLDMSLTNGIQPQCSLAGVTSYPGYMIPGCSIPSRGF